MYALKRISTGAPLATWSTIPGSFVCPLGEVNGASVGWESGDFRIESVAAPAPTKAELLAFAANKRWRLQGAGITVGGMHVPTDEETRGFLTVAHVKATANAAYTIRWKISAGNYVTLDATALIAIGDAVEAYIQSLFAANEAIDTKINAGTYTTTAAIDSATEWPD